MQPRDKEEGASLIEIYGHKFEQIMTGGIYIAGQDGDIFLGYLAPQQNKITYAKYLVFYEKHCESMKIAWK